MKTAPTEEELGIAFTPEEQEVLSRPAPIVEDDPTDDIPREDDEIDAQPEKPDGRKAREHGPDGKFLAKEADKAPEAKPEGVKPPPGYVDHRALQEERALRQQAEGRMQQILDAMNKREQREAAKVEAETAPVIPDRNTDPLGYMEYMDKRLSTFEQRDQQYQQQTQQQRAEQQEMDNILSYALPEYNAAAAADPNLEPIRQTLMDSFVREICFNNGIPTNTMLAPQQKAFVQHELNRMENAHIRQAVMTRQPIGQYLYDLAATRHITPQMVQQPNPAPQPGQKQIPIAERQSQQARHMSIGDLPGGALPAFMSAKDMVKMPQKEFNAVLAKLTDAEVDAMFSKAQ